MFKLLKQEQKNQTNVYFPFKTETNIIKLELKLRHAVLDFIFELDFKTIEYDWSRQELYILGESKMIFLVIGLSLSKGIHFFFDYSGIKLEKAT